MMGNFTHPLTIDLVLARALAGRGHRVKFVLCDRALPACEVKEAGRQVDWEWLCHRCYEFSRHMIDAAGFDFLKVSDLIRAERDTEHWPQHVGAGLLRHFRVGRLSDSQAVQNTRAKFQEAATISATIGKKIAALNPDRVIMSHGIYTTWGPAREVLTKAGTPVVVTAEGKRNNSIRFNWGAPADWWDVESEWERVSAVPLTESEEQELDSYLNSRRLQEDDYRQYNFGGYEELQKIRNRFDLDHRKPTYVLFTNLTWDAASIQRELAFLDPIEWVLDTIQWFAEEPDKQLIIKVHPAEVLLGTSQPFSGLIKDHFPVLPGNVRLIEPQDVVNSWAILNVADVGLVHTTTVGLELALEGVPCVVVSRTHYRGKGFTIDVETKDEYFGALSSPDSLSGATTPMKVLARRYAYLVFQRYQLSFPFLIQKKPFDVRAFATLDDEQVLRHETIELFIHALENQSDFLYASSIADGPSAAM